MYAALYAAFLYIKQLFNPCFEVLHTLHTPNPEQKNTKPISTVKLPIVYARSCAVEGAWIRMCQNDKRGGQSRLPNYSLTTYRFQTAIGKAILFMFDCKGFVASN